MVGLEVGEFWMRGKKKTRREHSHKKRRALYCLCVCTYINTFVVVCLFASFIGGGKTHLDLSSSPHMLSSFSEERREEKEEGRRKSSSRIDCWKVVFWKKRREKISDPQSILILGT